MQSNKMKTPCHGRRHRAHSNGSWSSGRLSRFLFPIMGLVSLAWFLVRVLPKPQRAAYPCQKAAAPVAAGFVIWLMGIFGLGAVLKTSGHLIRQYRWGLALLAVICGLLLWVVTSVTMPSSESLAMSYTPNAPIGTPRGLHPGRVVWAHDPDATDWAGYESSEHWYESTHTDEAVVERMVSNSVLALTGESTLANAWDALFRYSNQQQGKGDRGYQFGEKVVIKLNLTTSNGRQVDPVTHEKMPEYLNRGDNSPQMTLALLRQLVHVAGVAQTNIYIGDPTTLIPNHYWDFWHPEFPGVNYLDNVGGQGRLRVELSAMMFYWSTPEAAGKVIDYLPACYAEADYFINFAILKGHARAGVTLCAKNHYGSLLRTPDGHFRDAFGPDQDGYLDYLNMHHSLPNETPGLGHYRALVDLMGHPRIGGRTVLYLIDGLFGGDDWDCHAYPWTSPGFGDGVTGDWPSSVFMSQDPVAIDSVAFDFLQAEWPDVVSKGSLQGAAVDYLIEAALADNPPSETFYDPDNDGERMTSLGVHEHWNNPYEKQYSRNLGTGNGIELVRLDDARLQVRAYVQSDATHQLTVDHVLSNVAYEVMEASSLSQPNWAPLAPFTAGASAMTWTNFVASNWTNKFYRVRLVEATDNLLANPSFEDMGTTNTRAFAWQDNVQGGVWGAAKRVNWKAHSGDQSAVIVGDGTTFGGWWQWIQVDGGTTYLSSACFHKETNWHASEVIMKVEWFNQSHQQLLVHTNSLADLPNGRWTNKSFQVTAPIDAVSANFVLSVSGMGQGESLYMDSAYFGKPFVARESLPAEMAYRSAKKDAAAAIQQR